MRPRVILFPTDFGSRCDRPRDRAAGLARLWGARLVLLHVRQESERGLDVDSRSEEERLMASLRAEVDDAAIDVEVRLGEGGVADAILQTACDTAADLIVTGLSRRDDLGDFIVGTTVERVVRHASAPVLVVKRRAQGPYARVMIATDFSEVSAAALQTAVSMFPEAGLTLLHAYQVRFESLRGREGPAAAHQVQIVDEADAFLQGAALPAKIRGRIEIDVDYGDVCTVARHHVQSSGTDLAVVGTHGRSGAAAAVIGSTARALLGCLDCDVLLVRGPMRATTS